MFVDPSLYSFRKEILKIRLIFNFDDERPRLSIQNLSSDELWALTPLDWLRKNTSSLRSVGFSEDPRLRPLRIGARYALRTDIMRGWTVKSVRFVETELSVSLVDPRTKLPDKLVALKEFLDTYVVSMERESAE